MGCVSRSGCRSKRECAKTHESLKMHLGVLALLEIFPTSKLQEVGQAGVHILDRGRGKHALTRSPGFLDRLGFGGNVQSLLSFLFRCRDTTELGCHQSLAGEVDAQVLVPSATTLLYDVKCAGIESQRKCAIDAGKELGLRFVCNQCDRSILIRP